MVVGCFLGSDILTKIQTTNWYWEESGPRLPSSGTCMCGGSEARVGVL